MGVRSGKSRFGLGLFATQFFPRGATILRFEGPVLTLAEVRAKGASAADGLQIGVNRYCDLLEPGRLANHSCQPNAGVSADLTLVALQPIPVGTEIFFDYSTTIADGWTMPCGCALPKCRGVVRAFATLPESLRTRYLVLGCVPDFMRTDVGA